MNPLPVSTIVWVTCQFGHLWKSRYYVTRIDGSRLSIPDCPICEHAGEVVR